MTICIECEHCFVADGDTFFALPMCGKTKSSYRDPVTGETVYVYSYCYEANRPTTRTIGRVPYTKHITTYDCTEFEPAIPDYTKFARREASVWQRIKELLGWE